MHIQNPFGFRLGSRRGEYPAHIGIVGGLDLAEPHIAIDPEHRVRPARQG